MNNDPTPAQLHILEHATGVDTRRPEQQDLRAYRNYYLAGQAALDDCLALVALGLMAERMSANLSSRKESWRGRMFHVTEAGLEWLGIAGRA